MTERMTRASQIEGLDQLIREATWHIQKRVAHVLTDPLIDLTLPQLMTMLAIHQCGTCRMSSLAEYTQQSAGTLTGIVDRLIQDGLVERTRNAGDRRVVEVALTPAGAQRLRRALEASQASTYQMLANFNERDLEGFGVLLQRFLSNAQNIAHDDVCISSPDI